MSRIVAIDYGRKRVGIAMTDISGSFAMPFKTVLAGKTLDITAKLILDELKPYLKEIKTFVLGLPLYLDGNKSEMSIEVEDFKKVLEKLTKIPIIFVDEGLTSNEAESMLNELSLPRKKRSKNIDPIAAMIILKDYLESN